MSSLIEEAAIQPKIALSNLAQPHEVHFYVDSSLPILRPYLSTDDIQLAIIDQVPTVQRNRKKSCKSCHTSLNSCHIRGASYAKR